MTRTSSEIRDFLQKSSLYKNSHSLLIVFAGRLEDHDIYTPTPKKREKEGCYTMQI